MLLSGQRRCRAETLGLDSTQRLVAGWGWQKGLAFIMRNIRLYLFASIISLAVFSPITALSQGNRCFSVVPSGCYLDDPLGLALFLDGLDRRIERSQLLLEYFVEIADVEQAVSISEEQDLLYDLSSSLLWARAIRGAALQNFAALQEHLNRSNAGAEVELRPYTDGTMDIYMNGSWHARRQIEEVLEEIVSIYAPDRNWRASISPNGQDVDWAWDQFRDEYGNIVWRCRGKRSGEFLQDLFCMGQRRSDHTWPG